MHPQGDGLKLINNKSDEHVLAPLRQYKKKVKKEILLFSPQALANTKIVNNLQSI